MKMLVRNIIDRVMLVKNTNIGIVILLLSLVVQACVPKEQVILRSINIREVKTGSDGPLLIADVVFYNPNSTRMRLKRIDLDVTVDGNKSARVDQHLSALIKGRSEFTIPLEIQLNLKDGLLDTILSLFGGKEHNIRFEGSMKVTVRGFPVKVPVSYGEALKF